MGVDLWGAVPLKSLFYKSGHMMFKKPGGRCEQPCFMVPKTVE